MPRGLLRLNAALVDPSGQSELSQALSKQLATGSLRVVCQARQLWEDSETLTDCDLVCVAIDRAGDPERGLAVIRAVRQRDPQVPLVAIAARGNVGIAAKAIASGATDFLVASEQLDERIDTLLGKIAGLVELRRQNQTLAARNLSLQEGERMRFRLLGESPAMRAVLEQIRRVARIPRPVLILGERGTGKELVARAIHESSGEHGGPFIVVNCAAFVDTLLESELFGYERGAFTGAERTTLGRFEQAAGGTLFMDEIGNMSLPFQQKILRVVEYATFSRLGGTRELRSSARIVAATNADLEKKMQAGEFLRDLFDRLAFEVIKVPPLRNRRGDIRPLAEHFLTQFMSEIPSMRGKTLAASALEMLERYEFPGNVRELKNIVERAAYRDVTNEITPEDLGFLPAETPLVSGTGSFYEQLGALEFRLLEHALRDCHSNQAEAARRLGMTYDQFRHYARKHALT